MKKIFSLVFSFFICIIIFSCATAEGTALVTGTKRQATNSDEITIYLETPEKYEIIGIVSAYSDSG